MADPVGNKGNMAYAANSNLVITADRRGRGGTGGGGGRGDGGGAGGSEPTGEAASLWGKIEKGKFGDKAAVSKPDVVIAAVKTVVSKRKSTFQVASQHRMRPSHKMITTTRKHLLTAGGFTDILAATAESTTATSYYAPRTPSTRAAWELMLSLLAETLGGDLPPDALRSAADAVLETLKSEEHASMKDLDRKREVEEVISLPQDSLSATIYGQLVNLTKKITDFTLDGLADGAGGNADADQMDQDAEDRRLRASLKAQEEYGVAVAFDEEDEDEDDMALGEGETYEVQDALSDDEEEEVGDEFAPADDEGREALDSYGVDTAFDETAVAEDADEFIIPAQQPKSKQRAAIGANGNGTDHAFLDPRQVDAFYLQRTIAGYYSDPLVISDKTDAAFDILASSRSLRECENDLMALFDYENFDLVKLLTSNRDTLVWCTRLAKTGLAEEDRLPIIEEMKSLGLIDILEALSLISPATMDESMVVSVTKGTRRKAPLSDTMDIDRAAHVTTVSSGKAVPKTVIDLESLIFSQGSHLMSNKKVKLPEGSFKRTKKDYEEVHVPSPAVKPMGASERLVDIVSLPDWAQPAFKSATSLNRIQSAVYPVAFQKDENMLLCAPTGAGKTNCAMLTILREIGKNRNVEGHLQLDNFKIVYIAPMKALVAEMVGNFGSRLAEYGITVAELTGDRQLTKAQIAQTQLIVTTPEKWDIITRKAHDRSYTNLVRLIIIDEIHLLHDERGPVLEALISRTIRSMQSTQQLVRLVGLSATLPNYMDVAHFMRVNPKTGVFHFDNSFRPCPLQQTYVGITAKRAIKRIALMNELAYEKVIEGAGKHQSLVFCHSRKETAKTAKAIRDLAIAKDTIGSLLAGDAASREILTTEAANVKNADLADLLPYGFGIHHAGMNRADRTIVEELFAGGHIQALVSTSTLAWGVNLPAHSVIIKGTQVYSPEKGKWTELSPQDVLQMLGRAGRPQFDTHGEGTIITTHGELQYYLSLLNAQLPIESQFVAKLADNLNAEIVLGTIRSREDAVEWLGYTYLYVRMLRNGPLYGVSPNELAEDPYLTQKRTDLIHSAAALLEKAHLIKYDRKSGLLQGTELGRIASHYYISHATMSTFVSHLRPTSSLVDLFRVFALAEEFKLIPVREEEKLELAKLMERIPIPIKEASTDPTAKLNTLLQAYISQLKLDGFALMADMVYVTQSAGRILRAIFEICMRSGWAQLARKALDLCKMVSQRMWLSMSPLRQVSGFPSELIKKLERKEFPWERYYDLSVQELGELVGVPRAGKMIHKAVHQFPKLELQAHVQPITRSLLRIELTITPDYQFDEKVSGGVFAEPFWVVVEDTDGERILHHDVFLLKPAYMEEDHFMSFTVPLSEPLPPNIFISLLSDRWLHSETKLPVSFKHLILPSKFPAHTELLDLQPLPVSDGLGEEFEPLFPTFTHFNSIQTQVFNTAYKTDDSLFVGAPAGSGKTVIAELAVLRAWEKDPRARIVYVAPYTAVVESRLKEWKAKFGSLLGGKNIVALTGESAADVKLLEGGDIIFAAPEHWDLLSRRWKQRKAIQKLGLFIMEALHLIGSDIGPTIEVITSRIRFISAQTENPIRIIALSASLGNARDVGEWIGVPNRAIYNFHNSVRPTPLEIHIQSFNIPHFNSLMIAMYKPVYNAVRQHCGDRPAMIFVPSRKQASLTALELIVFCRAEGDSRQFLHCSEDELKPYLDKVSDPVLQHTLSFGIGFLHWGLSKNDQKIVMALYESQAIQVLAASKEVVWGLTLKSYLVILMGCQTYNGREHRYVDYTMPDVLQMIGVASMPEEDKCVALIMCTQTKKDFYKKFLFDALPVESHLDHALHDHFNAEIVTKTIENKQDAVDYLTWTFLYRRMSLNPNYYNLAGVSHVQLSDHLSELVEVTLEDLANSKCISIEDDDLSPLNLGMIAAFYYINYVTIEAFSLSLKSRTKLRGLLEIVSAAAEFNAIPIRLHEDVLLERLYNRLPVKLDNPNFNDPHVKTHILLQSHFSRFSLPADLESDQKKVLSKVVSLLQSIVDVISSNGWLSPALNAMEMCQMVIQAMWDRDSPLKQIPHVTDELLHGLTAAGVESVFDVADLEDEQRQSLLPLTTKQIRDVAKFVNGYPNVELAFELSESAAASGDTVTMRVTLEREDEPAPVSAPYYPKPKEENWYVVIGDSKKNLLAIKRTNLAKKVNLKLDFTLPEGLDANTTESLKIYLMCDSYMGVDQEFDFDMEILEAEEDEEEEENGGDEDMDDNDEE